AREDVDVCGWTRANAGHLDRLLRQHGALLFRGFGIDSPPRLERLAEATGMNLFEDNGEHTRTQIGGKVYTPVAYSSEKPILWHNENSFNEQWPMKIWFCCQKPASQGGETPIVDSRQVYRALSPDVRTAFLERGVMY